MNLFSFVHVSNSTIDNPTIDDQQQTTRILSMNIPVDNRNPRNSSSFNIEIEDEQPIDSLNEQLEVFVGFYRPGEYQRETLEDDDDDDGSDLSQKSETQKKEEQVRRDFNQNFDLI